MFVALWSLELKDFSTLDNIKSYLNVDKFLFQNGRVEKRNCTQAFQFNLHLVTLWIKQPVIGPQFHILLIFRDWGGRGPLSPWLCQCLETWNLHWLHVSCIVGIWYTRWRHLWLRKVRGKSPALAAKADVACTDSREAVGVISQWSNGCAASIMNMFDSELARTSSYQRRINNMP